MGKYYCYIQENVFEHITSEKLLYETKSKRLMRAWRKKNLDKNFVIKYGINEENSCILDSYRY